jgi:hypothetical protein
MWISVMRLCASASSMRGDVGVNQIAGCLRQYTWHVQRSLAIADNYLDFAPEIERTVAIVWVPPRSRARYGEYLTLDLPRDEVLGDVADARSSITQP